MPNALDDRAVCGIIKLATCRMKLRRWDWLPAADLPARLPLATCHLQRAATCRILRRNSTQTATGVDCITGQVAKWQMAEWMSEWLNERMVEWVNAACTASTGCLNGWLVDHLTGTGTHLQLDNRVQRQYRRQAQQVAGEWQEGEVVTQAKVRCKQRVFYWCCCCD